MQLLLIFAGGGLGSLARYALSLAFPLADGAFPTGTFLANTLASLLAGLLFGYALTTQDGLLPWRSFLLVGFCGGFSTFSTFSLESYSLFQAGHWWLAAVYALCSFAACLIGTALGVWLVRA